MKSSWIQGSPNSQKRRGHTEKQDWCDAGATRNQKRQESLLFQNLQREHGSINALILDSGLQICARVNFNLLRDKLSGQSQETSILMPVEELGKTQLMLSEAGSKPDVTQTKKWQRRILTSPYDLQSTILTSLVFVPLPPIIANIY